MSFDPRVVRRAQFTRADFDIQIASLALLYYDYLLTLPDEIEYIWKKPKKLSTVFYVCCRYYLVANLLWTLTKMNVGLRYYSLIHSTATQYPLSLVLSASSVTWGFLVCFCPAIYGKVAQSSLIAVWGLRTYALCQRNKIIAGTLGAIGAAVIVALIAREPFTKCSDPAVLTRRKYPAPPLFRLDSCIKLSSLSWYCSWRFGNSIRNSGVRDGGHSRWSSIREDARFWEHPTRSLNYIIFSQGLLYLSAVLVITIVTAVCNLQVWGGFARPLNSLKLPLSTLLTARFLLELRKYRRMASSGEAGVVSTSMSFNGVKGGDEDPSKSYETESTATFNERIDTPPRKWTRKSEIKVVEELGQNIGPTRSPLGDGVAQETKEATLEMVHIGDIRQPHLPSAVAQEPVRSSLDIEAREIVEAQR